MTFHFSINQAENGNKPKNANKAKEGLISLQPNGNLKQ